VTIIDIKTGKNVPSQQVMEESWQTRIYNIAARKMYPNAKTVMMVYWYLRDRKYVVFRSAEMAEKDEQRLVEIAREIRAVDTPECSPSLLCRWCPYFNDCPNFEEERNSQKTSTIAEKGDSDGTDED
jgi:RecB family exonuclease